uniref:Ig-like domain-containing protein n=1 Tax=Branchiostoma floridae TaxID=7739 RepID=C3YL23_BRAFL|eukprot:XP_002603002.1 hypothetical protein BRAFLDRAFT_123976 [Branchiostoma floridae]
MSQLSWYRNGVQIRDDDNYATLISQRFWDEKQLVSFLWCIVNTDNVEAFGTYECRSKDDIKISTAPSETLQSFSIDPHNWTEQANDLFKELTTDRKTCKDGFRMCADGIRVRDNALSEAAKVVVILLVALVFVTTGPWIKEKFLERDIRVTLENIQQMERSSEGSHHYDVFISYSSSDGSWVREDLLGNLESNGYTVCLDTRDFQAGSHFGRIKSIDTQSPRLVVLGQSQDLRCHFEFNPLDIGLKLKFAWYKDSKRVSDTSDGRITISENVVKVPSNISNSCRVPKNTLLIRSILSIRNADKSDYGVYSCNLTIYDGDALTKAGETHISSIDTFTLGGVPSALGWTFSLPCEYVQDIDVADTDVAELSWYRNGQRITEDDNHHKATFIKQRFRVLDTVVSFLWCNITMEKLDDFGTYTCRYKGNKVPNESLKIRRRFVIEPQDWKEQVAEQHLKLMLTMLVMILLNGMISLCRFVNRKIIERDLRTTLNNIQQMDMLGEGSIEERKEGSYDVFISYSSKDASWVRNDLSGNLERNGYRVCLDTRDFIVVKKGPCGAGAGPCGPELGRADRSWTVRAGAGISAGRSWTVRAGAGPYGPELEFNGESKSTLLPTLGQSQEMTCRFSHFAGLKLFWFKGNELVSNTLDGRVTITDDVVKGSENTFFLSVLSIRNVEKSDYDEYHCMLAANVNDDMTLKMEQGALVSIFTLIDPRTQNEREGSGHTFMYLAGSEATKEGAKAVFKETVKNTLREGAKEGAKKVVQEGSKTVIKETAREGAKQVAKEGAVEFVLEAATSGIGASVVQGTTVFASETTKTIVNQGGTSFAKNIITTQGPVGIGLTLAEEAYNFVNHRSESQEKLEKGEISETEYNLELAGHAAKGVATGSAVLVGSTIGQALIPVPIVGGVIGAMGGKAVVWMGEQVLTENEEESEL